MRTKLFLLLAIALLIPIAVSAQDTPPTPSNPPVLTGSMVVDCNTLQGKALAYAQEVGICPEFTPNATDTRVGNCGQVTLTIEDELAEGNALFRVQVQSFIGPMTSVSYNIPWSNTSTGMNNAVVGGVPIGVGTVYNDSRTVFTGAGLVVGGISGFAQVAGVLRCDFIPFTVAETIT